MDTSLALATFFEESQELLTQMEAILLRAEADELEDDDMNALFRCAHTIKGSAGMFGLDAVVHFTHDVESLLDRVRNGAQALTLPLVALLLECGDHIAVLLAAVQEGATPNEAGGQVLQAKLRAYGAEALPIVVAASKEEVEARLETSGGGHMGNDHWHLSLRFSPEVLQYGFDPLALISYLQQFGTIVHLETVSDALPDLFSADAELCYLGFEIALNSTSSKTELESVFEFVEEHAQIRILPPQSRVDEFINLIQACGEGKQRLGEMLLACGTLTAKELEAALSLQQQAGGEPKLGTVLVEQGIVQATVVEAALDKQRKTEGLRANESKSVKVPADRLDALIDQVGELVIAGAAAELQAKRTHQRALQEAASNLLRLVEDVRDTALRLRMIPIGEVFSRFPRVVRDLSKELGKDIELRINGAEAELDKSMVEKIGDPLMHLVRNSIDHGIESPAQRVLAGKPECGTVTLNAYHESGSIVIEVSDDGAGLDQARILKKAIERGLVDPGSHLESADIYRLILEPGFSTAEQITNLSGRGVGMDVVKSNVEALRGSLDIESVPGKGTTMRICLPLTLAIIDGFQVGIGTSTFILPLDTVVECIELPPGSDHADYLDLRGKVLPFLRLRSLFVAKGEAPARQNIIVVRFGGKMAGIAVDRLLGECQAVIKPLGRLFSNLSSISGSTILGNGEVALILDVAQLVQLAAGGEARAVRQPIYQ